MYQMVVGAGAAAGVLFYFSVYGSRSNCEAVTNNHNSSTKNIDEVLRLIEDDKTEKNFNTHRNTLAKAIEYLELNPKTILGEKIWSERTPKKSALCDVKSVLINSEGYTSTEHLDNILHSASSSSSYISSLAREHIEKLIQSGHVKEAYVLHNVFFLLNKTAQHTACNVNSLDLALPLSWMGKWLGYPEPCTKEAEKNQTEAMKKILPFIIFDPAFTRDFKSCLEEGIYQTKKELSRKRMG